MNINIYQKWDKTKAYAKYEIVRNNSCAYYAVRDVPANTEISDRFYWLLIYANGSTVNHEKMQTDNIDRAIEGGGGGGIRLLPTTGTSTVDGMTQKAITDAINAVPGGGIVLQPTTGSSTKDGMTQKAITDELNAKASAEELERAETAINSKAEKSSVLALQNELETIRVAGEATQAELTEFKGDVVLDLAGIIERVDSKQNQLVAGSNITLTPLQDGTTQISSSGGGGGSVVLQPTTGQSTTDGMTQKAITDELNNRATTEALSQVQTALEGKASNQELSELTIVVSGKASQADLAALQTTVAGKADQSSLTALETTVSGKANQSSLDALETTVSGKANQSSLEALETIVSGKADQSSLTALATAVEGKQNQLIAGENVTLTPLQDGTTRISSSGGSGGGGNAIITFDTEYQYLQIRDDNGTDIGFSKETANTVRIQEYAKDDRGQVQNIFDETLASTTYVNNAVDGNSPYVYWDDAIFGYTNKSGDKFDIYADQNTNQKIDFKFRNENPESSPKSYTVPTIEVTDGLQTQINTRIGTHFEVGVEKWCGTYTEDGITYQVYNKIIKIDALPATAGITNYPHGITGIKQILQAYGFTGDGFILNAPRQNSQDNIAIYQVQKNGNIGIEVGKDRSSKNAYICLVYAKNN